LHRLASDTRSQGCRRREKWRARSGVRILNAMAGSRVLSAFTLALSACCLALTAHFALRDPKYLVPFGAIALLTLAPLWLARRRMRRLLLSGDVMRLLGVWSSSLDRVAQPETMGPLLMATAYASYGWLEAARNALQRAARGPAWDGALEQRLFVEALLDTYEGDRTAAVAKAEALERMPLPTTGRWARRRAVHLRAGVAALTRAFAHKSLEGDERTLEHAARSSPLVYWAMRYALAVLAVDRGRAKRVRELLAGAPLWPEESAFRAYHDELVNRAS
jgi:hypothetical protein